MFVTILTCNLGRSGGNRSLLFSSFSRVSLCFVLECLVRKDGVVKPH